MVFQCPEGTKKPHWTFPTMPLSPLPMGQYTSSAQPGAISPCSRDTVESPDPFPATHKLLFGPPWLTWDLTFHLAVARLLSCHHSHLSLPCLDAEKWHPIAAATSAMTWFLCWCCGWLLAPQCQPCSWQSLPLWFHTHTSSPGCLHSFIPITAAQKCSCDCLGATSND